MSTIVKVLQELLRHHIPLVDIRTIAEKLIENAKISDPDELTEMVRIALRRMIIQGISGNNKELPVAIIDHDLHKSCISQSRKNLEVKKGDES